MCAIVDGVGVFHSDQVPPEYPQEHYLRTVAAAAIPRDLRKALRADESCLRNACIRGEKTPTYRILEFDSKLEEIRKAARKLVDEADSFVVVSANRVETPAYRPPVEIPTGPWTEAETDRAEPASPIEPSNP